MTIPAPDARARAATHFRRGGVGANVLRNEDARYLDGGGEYLADLPFADGMEVAFLRSPVAHAIVRNVRPPHGSADRVFLLGDLGHADPIRAVPSAPGFQASDYPALADGRVRFVGEPIAICIGRNRAEAEDVAQGVRVDLDELPAVVDLRAALAGGSPQVHEHWNGNLFCERVHEGGDLDAARAAAAVVVDKRVRMHRHAAVPIEGRGVLARHDRRLDELVVHSSTQFPHVVRTALAALIGVPEHRLRVVAPDVGGGFGVKNNLQPEEIAVAALARRLGIALRWIEDRREHLLASPHARDHHYDLTAFADAAGRILGVDATVMVDAGAYSVWPWTASMEAGMAAGILTGPYDIPAFRARALSVCTNKSPLGPYRGVGRTGACFAMERLLESVAHALGREPAEVRAANLVRPGAMPYRSVNGKLYDSGDYPGALGRAIAAIDVEAVRARQGRGEADGRRIGVGFASYTEQTAHGTAEWVARGLPVVFGYEAANARFTPDGELVLHVGIQNHGQGLETTLAQVARESLGVEVARVAVRHGDSSASPYGMGTFASRSMVMAGGAVDRACRELAAKVRRIGAHLLQAPPDEVRIDDGGVCAGDARVTLREVAQAAYLHPERLPPGEAPGLESTAVYEPEVSSGAFAYATHACVVAVDEGTGAVELLDYVAVHDCGTLVNPTIVEAQVVGGIAQGIGTALYEEMPFDADGQPLASTLMDYRVPGMSEIPDVRVIHVETPSPNTAFGIKGMGEGGAIAPPAAIANAIVDALRRAHPGRPPVEVDETPITPRRLLRAIAAAASPGGAP